MMFGLKGVLVGLGVLGSAAACSSHALVPDGLSVPEFEYGAHERIGSAEPPPPLAADEYCQDVPPDFVGCWPLVDRISDLQSYVGSVVRHDGGRCVLKSDDERPADEVECGVVRVILLPGYEPEDVEDLVAQAGGRVLMLDSPRYRSYRMEVPVGAERATLRHIMFDPRIGGAELVFLGGNFVF